MSATILDGKRLAGEIQRRLKKEVTRLRAETGAGPHLVNVMIGNDAGACAYANAQKRVADDIGVQYTLTQLSPDISSEEFLEYLKTLNRDPCVHGIMIHKPLPPQIDGGEVANRLDPIKDVEGINITNIGRMLLGDTALVPCTPAAVMEHIASTGVPLRGKEAVIVGASDIVGKPLSLLLLQEMATVSVCHIATSEAGRLIEHVGRADILVVAVGKAGLIKGKWIKPGAIVIDVGINSLGNRIVGDVEFETARQRAAFITPVPGGVGPLTVVMLMKNGLSAYKLQKS